MARTPDVPALTPLANALVVARTRRLKSVDDSTRASATQTAIAKACDVAQPTVSGWESGEEMPHVDRLGAIAKAYGLKERKLRALWFRTRALKAAA